MAETTGRDDSEHVDPVRGDAGRGDTGRVYNGVESDERVAQRRGRLIQAGLDILGDPLGPDDLTLRTICRRAELAQRYFYESFADKDVFAAAVYDWALAQIITATQAALDRVSAREGTRAGIGEVVRVVAEDRRIGQLLFSPHQVNAVVLAKRYESTGMFVSLFSAQVRHEFHVDEHGRAPLTSHFVVGGVAQAIAAWLNGDVEVGRDALVDELVGLLAAQGVGRANRV